MDVNEMTREDFESLPIRKWNEDIGEFNSLIILPGKKNDIHDSGYRCMDFVAIKENMPVCRLSGCSDVIHIDGIGGFGYKWFDKFGAVPHMVKPSGWAIDCLPKSGLLRIWPISGKMTCGEAISSFQIFALEREKND